MKRPNIRCAARANNFTPQTTHSMLTNTCMPIWFSPSESRSILPCGLAYMEEMIEICRGLARVVSRLTQVWTVPRKKTFSVIYRRPQDLRGGQRHQLAVNVLRVVDFARGSEHVLCVLEYEG